MAEMEIDTILFVNAQLGFGGLGFKMLKRYKFLYFCCIEEGLELVRWLYEEEVYESVLKKYIETIEGSGLDQVNVSCNKHHVLSEEKRMYIRTQVVGKQQV